MKTVHTPVLEIAYLEHGPPGGPPVVLLHGFPDDVHAYAEVAPALAARGMRVLVPWLRGYGPTRFLEAATPRSGEQAALGADLRDFLAALDLGPNGGAFAKVLRHRPRLLRLHALGEFGHAVQHHPLHFAHVS